MITQSHEIQMQQLSPLLGEIVAANGTVEMTVTGNSMRPMLYDRESRVRLSKSGELKKGDLPLYRRENGTYVLHRIVKADREILTCCGDAQWHLESGLTKEQVLAVVTDFTWRGRWVPCSSKLYQLYWHIWVWIRPLRHLAFGGFNRIRRIFSK